ncbi:hypothetical protein HDU87_005340 [Geranomyces variabilis]|uniref:Uncharacterized protein n=1 Tax=Geranomyces variabilis TaxID=109894 RepID=A0AAD5TH11_9FUNG|nr:hypothetical protein HDU87_005340 [Geranomyces variabilis]
MTFSTPEQAAIELLVKTPLDQRPWNEDCETTLTAIATGSEPLGVRWPYVRELIKTRVHRNIVSASLHPSEWDRRREVEEYEQRLGHLLNRSGDETAPVTLQRLCELAVSPAQHYTDLLKYLRGLYCSGSKF